MKKSYLLISDIDDTLKRTHRLSKTDTIKKGVRSRNFFVGMPELYLSFACEGLEGAEKSLGLKRRAIVRSPHRVVAYVTGAISKFQWFSSLFLIRSNFPLGLYLGRDEGSSFEFKMRAIEGLIRDFPEHEIILVGDNGEDDPLVFEAMSQLGLPNKIYFFVHAVYPRAVGEGMQRFVSSLSLAIHFFNRGWISEDSLRWNVEEVKAALKDDVQKVVPGWVSSAEIKDFWPKIERRIDEDLLKQTQVLERYIIKRVLSQSR